MLHTLFIHIQLFLTLHSSFINFFSNHLVSVQNGNYYSLFYNFANHANIFHVGTSSDLGPNLKTGLIGVGAGSATAGCLGAGIGQGFSAGKAAEAIGRNPEAIDKVRTIMIIGAAIAESGAIYSLLVAIILLFVYGK